MVSEDYTGLLSNQGEKSINLFFHNGSVKKKTIRVWYSKAQYKTRSVRAPYKDPYGLHFKAFWGSFRRSFEGSFKRFKQGLPNIHFSYLLICSGLLIIDRTTSEQVLRIRLPQYGDRVCWVAHNRLLIPKIAHGICGNSSYGSKINYGKDPPA